MPHIALRLFGAAELLRDGQPARLHSARTLALLAFLALERERAHDRTRLAGLLWEGATESAARQSLRQALYSLRALTRGVDGCLDAGKESVRFVPHPQFDVDVHRFIAGAERAEPAGWAEAAALYRAPLLAAGVPDLGTAFAGWLDEARARLHAAAVHNLDRLVLARIAAEDWPGARALSETLRALDPLREATARHLFRIAAAAGDAAGIEAEWRRLANALAQALGVAPSGQTEALYRSLRRHPESTPLDQHGTPPAGDAVEDRLAVDALLRGGRAAERVYAFGHAQELYARALALVERSGAAAAARRYEILLAQEAVLERLGRRAEQLAAIDALLAVARELDDPARIAHALLREAGAAAYVGDPARARRAAMLALETFRRARDAPGEAEALRELGFVAWRNGNHGEALEHARAALALHRRLGDVAGEATALHNLAEIHRSLGSPQQALEWYGHAIELHWSARNRAGEILTAFGMAHAFQQAGDARAAHDKYEQALALSERYGERTMQSRALHALALQRRTAGDLDEALAFMRRAVETDRAINYAHALGHDLVDLGLLHALRGERAEARAALEEALVWFAFTADAAAGEATRRHLADLGAGRVPAAAASEAASGVKSHLPLAEGKVYCEFESPLGRARAPR